MGAHFHTVVVVVVAVSSSSLSSSPFLCAHGQSVFIPEFATNEKNTVRSSAMPSHMHVHTAHTRRGRDQRGPLGVKLVCDARDQRNTRATAGAHKSPSFCVCVFVCVVRFYVRTDRRGGGDLEE